MEHIIIFDWGGVLAPSDNKIAAVLLKEKYNIDEQHFMAFCTNHERLEKNLVDDSAYREALEKEFDIPKEIIIKALNSACPNEVYEYAKSLSQKCSLYLLSDQMKFRTEHIKSSYDLSFFTETFFSNEIKISKPHKAAFEYVLEKIHKKPEECVFIDDKPENIKTAKEMGFVAVLFKDLGHLKQELQNIGIV